MPEVAQQGSALARLGAPLSIFGPPEVFPLFSLSSALLSLPRTKCRTYHDVIPISCLTEFPNVVQMAKVRP